MNIQNLLIEYNLEIDDVRWYLSQQMCEQISNMIHRPEEFTKFIWSGELHDDLYNMEESYLQKMQDQADEKTMDEGHIRDIFKEMELARRRRYGY